MTSLHPNMQHARDWLNSQASAMERDLETLCNQNSGSENPAGLHRVSEWLVDFFSDLGSTVHRIALPSYPLLDDSGAERQCDTGPALRWDLGAPPLCTAQRRLLWTIHYDTVYEPADPFQSCQRLPENRLRGPGVIDAKGGIVILRYAAMAAVRFLDWADRGLTLILTPDEEVGSPASLRLWKDVVPEFEFAMLFEPAMADGSLVRARKGTGTFSFLVRGRSAHSGRNFTAGRNAVVQACRIATLCHQLNGQREGITINVGRIRGGQAVNVVPDVAVLRVNVRVASPEDQAWVEDQLLAIAAMHHAPEEGFQVAVQGGITAPPKTIDATTVAWMAHVEAAGRELGQNVRWKESGGASDGNKLQALGLPNLDTFGPEGDALHSDQEWIHLPSLPAKAALTVGVLDRWLRA